MTMNNKILTVSYGTFSCTLEGFDDSFGTMKAIAEYFRDLAADDRYFGAEPPVPDAEMLTRIAEREISRRVEARHHDGRIVLSAADAAEEAVQAQPEADAQPAATPVVAAVIAGAVAEASAADDAEAAAPDTVLDPQEVTVENIAATLEEDAVQTEVEEETEEVSAVLELTEEDEVATPELVPEEAEADIPAEDDPSLSEAEAFFASSEDQVADEIEEDSADVVEAVEVEAPAAPAADSIAAKLQRIRAVVSQSQDDEDEDELFEDEHAEDLPSEGDVHTLSEEIAADEEATASDDVVAQAARDIEDAFDIDDAESAAEETEAQEEDELSALLARFDRGDVAEAPQEAAVAETDDAEEEDMGLDTLAALMAADQEPDDVSGDGENLFGGAEAGEEENVAAEMDDSVAAEADEAEAEAEDPPRRARVYKVKRADIDAALADGQLEQVEDEDAEADTASTLSEHEEAELLAELAQVESEFPVEGSDADQADVDADLEEAEVLEDDAEPTIAAESKQLDVPDDDVTRLMAEAENQMEEPEGTNRRDAFAHLKAAVQAKKADSEIGNDSIKDEGAFRSDLAEVVKPRRPEVGTSRADRPETARPAPLKLVAEQRVDIDAAPKGPVRPRRIAAPQEVAQDTQSAENFADYAAELGANDLPALLEAAASYLSFVEGQDQFSRPQLMTKVRQIEKEDFSREDSLRSFGQLLRAGKIEKISGGRFAVTSDIGYRPEQRAAG
ncbi:MAG: hypothetical protein ABNH38_19495 [Tateyamaria sp.]|uniref:hypothetical protein n=1 Tax=Tateyamaria sp. TaxID=1929288 RepID=UPI0032DCF8B7